MFRKVQIPTVPGQLLLHSMPGRYEPFDEFLETVEEKGVSAIVALTPREEIAGKSPHYGHALKHGDKRLPEVIEAPIPDFGVPKEEKIAPFFAALSGARRRLSGGETILVHCGAGHGRTGMFAAALLCRLGSAEGEALRIVDQARSAPETPEQRALVERVAREPDFGTLGLEIGDELAGPNGARATVGSGGGGTLVQMVEPPQEGLVSLLFATRKILGVQIKDHSQALRLWSHKGKPLGE